MASNRPADAERAAAAASHGQAASSDARRDSLDRMAETAPLDITSDAAGVPAQRAVIEQAMAQQNVRLARSSGDIGPVGRTVLLIVALGLVGLLALCVVLAS